MKERLLDLEKSHAKATARYDQLSREIEDEQLQIQALVEYFKSMTNIDKDHPTTWTAAAHYMNVLLIQIGVQKVGRHLEMARHLIAEKEQEEGRDN